jgi:hypothetical protein
MEFLVQEILRLNIASQDSDSDDEVSALSSSDSDILETVEKADLVEFLSDSDDDVSALSSSDSDISETVEKADLVEFLDDDSSTLAGSEADLYR